MKRKKLIAALTAAAMVVTMLPSVALAATGDKESDITLTAPVVSPAGGKYLDKTVTQLEVFVNKNVSKDVTVTKNGNTKTFSFKTEDGKKLPYANWPQFSNTAELQNGNYVHVQLELGSEFKETSTLKKLNGPEKKDGKIVNTKTTVIPASDVYEKLTGKASGMDYYVRVPEDGSMPTFHVTYDVNATTVDEILVLDFSGVKCETADDYNVQANMIEASALDKTFKSKGLKALDAFVNKNVTGNFNAKSSMLTLTSEDYLPYKTGFKEFSTEVTSQEGNYVAYAFTTGELSRVTGVTPADAKNMVVASSAEAYSCLKRIDEDTVKNGVEKLTVSAGDARQQIIVDYEGLKLVSKKEAVEAESAANLITKTIPTKIENTEACKNAIGAARAAYDALTDGGKSQLQAMHADAYNALINAEKEFAAFGQGAPTTPGGTTTTNPTDVVQTGAIVKVANATYKVTGAATVTFQKPAKNAKNVKVPATVKIKGKTYKVTAIAAKAFKGNKKVKTVTVGKNVKTIGASAFQNCKALTKVTLPAKTTTIGKNAFASSKNLKKVIIKSKKMTKKTVKAGAFKKVSKKTTIDVPNKKVKAYTKLFRQKGLPKACKIK